MVTTPPSPSGTVDVVAVVRQLIRGTVRQHPHAAATGELYASLDDVPSPYRARRVARVVDDQKAGAALLRQGVQSLKKSARHQNFPIEPVNHRLEPEGHALADVARETPGRIGNQHPAATRDERRERSEHAEDGPGGHDDLLYRDRTTGASRQRLSAAVSRNRGRPAPGAYRV